MTSHDISLHYATCTAEGDRVDPVSIMLLGMISVKILSGGQRMAKVQNGLETLPKLSTG